MSVVYYNQSVAASVRTRLNHAVNRIVSREESKRIAHALKGIVQDAARKQRKSSGSKGGSVWSRIAKGVYVRHLVSGDRTELSVSCSHPAAQLKQYGGWIQAGGPWSEPSPFTNRKSKLIPMSLSNGGMYGKRLGLQAAYKFNTSSEDDEGDDSNKRGHKGSHSRFRLHSISLLKMLKPSQEALADWNRARAERSAWTRKRKSIQSGASGSSVAGFGGGIYHEDMSWFKVKTKEELHQLIEDKNYYEFDVYWEDHAKWKKWKNLGGSSRHVTQKKAAAPPPLPKRPVGTGQNLVNMWIKRIEATAKRTLGKKSWHRKKEEFIAQARLVFTKPSRTEMVPLYLLVPSWFIPPHKGTGWLPSVRSITASLAYRLKRK